MSRLLSKYSIILVFIIATVSIFLAGAIAVFVFWGVLKMASISTDYWAMLEAIATAFAASAVLGTVFVAYIQLSEIYNSRYIEVANKLFDELNSTENIEARRWVFQKLPDNPEESANSLPLEGRDAIKKVLNSLDHVAFLTQAGWIPEELVMPWMHPMIAKSWFKLKPYVEYERQRRNEPYYYAYASNIAERCIVWRNNNISNADQVLWVNDAL